MCGLKLSYLFINKMSMAAFTFPPVVIKAAQTINEEITELEPTHSARSWPHTNTADNVNSFVLVKTTIIIIILMCLVG